MKNKSRFRVHRYRRAYRRITDAETQKRPSRNNNKKRICIFDTPPDGHIEIVIPSSFAIPSRCKRGWTDKREHTG